MRHGSPVLWLLILLPTISLFAANPLDEKDPYKRMEQFKNLQTFSPTSDTWKWLLAGLSDPTIEVREAAISSLGLLLRKEGSLPTELKGTSGTLLSLAKDPQVKTQSWAFEILSRYQEDDPDLADKVKAVLEKNESAESLRWGVGTLGKLLETDQKHVVFLAGYLTYKDLSVAKAAANVLAELGEKSAPATEELIKAYQTGLDRSIRGFSAEALSKIGPSAKAALPALLKGARQDDSLFVRYYSISALRSIAPADEKVVELFKVIKNEEPSSFVRSAITGGNQGGNQGVQGF